MEGEVVTHTLGILEHSAFLCFPLHLYTTVFPRMTYRCSYIVCWGTYVCIWVVLLHLGIHTLPLPMTGTMNVPAVTAHDQQSVYVHVRIYR